MMTREVNVDFVVELVRGEENEVSDRLEQSCRRFTRSISTDGGDFCLSLFLFLIFPFFYSSSFYHFILRIVLLIHSDRGVVTLLFLPKMNKLTLKITQMYFYRSDFCRLNFDHKIYHEIPFYDIFPSYRIKIMR